MKILLSLILSAILSAAPAPQAPPAKSRLSFQDALPVLAAMQELLPEALARRADGSGAWETWLESEDAQIRARLERGEEDSLVNFLLFGASFTKRPRLVRPDVEGKTEELVAARISDLLRALESPGANEHLLYARSLLERKGHRLGSAAARQEAARYLLEQLARVSREQQEYKRELALALSLPDATRQFAARSTLYRDRGLSLDTSLAPSFAVEEALKELKARGLLKPGAVRRAAVIGPGLEFTDKRGGYDYYPPQTLQPFALMDTLLRLRLAAPGLQVTSLDISPRLNAHLAHARRLAAKRRGYRIELPLDAAVAWRPGFRTYWQNFGRYVGAAVTPMRPPPTAGRVEARAVRVRPDFVARLQPVDLNVMVEHLDLPESERLDLIIATNVFVYYDAFRQALALANIERMLRSGGVLLSNNALPELPASAVRSAGYTTVVYSDRPDDGDHMVWYVRR
ncbi:MAG TPA: class I SAM-dependent methyltransferase [Bryobacteraceae bacterium]|nr:class I SAM-dependent methyltransferase [Bryobacteraceae bacterium]